MCNSEVCGAVEANYALKVCEFHWLICLFSILLTDELRLLFLPEFLQLSVIVYLDHVKLLDLSISGPYGMAV
jgi:hypothetical protein